MTTKVQTKPTREDAIAMLQEMLGMWLFASQGGLTLPQKAKARSHLDHIIERATELRAALEG